MQAFVLSNPQFGFALILQLTGVHGNQQFDKLTKTKTIETMLTAMNAEGIKKYIDYLFTQTDEPNARYKSHVFRRWFVSSLQTRTDVRATNFRRLWIIDQLGALIRNSGIPKDDDWILSVLNWLVVQGLFIVNKKSSKSPFRAVCLSILSFVPKLTVCVATYRIKPPILWRSSQKLPQSPSGLS